MTPQTPIDKFEVFATGVDHPECVAFDRDGFLWCGGELGQIYRIDPNAKVECIANLGGFTGGIAFSPSDELFVCNPALGMVHVKRDGSHEIFASHAGDRKLICPNYPVFDRAGNLYVSDSGQWKKGNGALVRFTPDGKGETIAGPFGYANGLALSLDEKSIFMVESDFNRVWRLELKSDGSIGQKEIYATETGRLPDGLTLDTEGNLYVSCYASDDIHKITPAREKTLFAWDPWSILLSRPTNMTFGAPDLSTMYIANLGRTTITRAHLNIKGQPLVNLRT